MVVVPDEKVKFGITSPAVVNEYVVLAVVATKLIVPRPVRARVIPATNVQLPSVAEPMVKTLVVAAKVNVPV